MQALGIILIIGCVGYVVARIWADLFPNPIIDHDSAAAHVQGKDEDEG